VSIPDAGQRYALHLGQIINGVVAAYIMRKPVEESIGRSDDQAIVRPGAVLAIRFAHKFAGVIGFQILHHGNSAGSFDVLLVFSHGGDLRFCMKKAPCLQNR
jgi:hypothetical protein